MRINLWTYFSAGIAIAAGLIVLMGYFFPLEGGLLGAIRQNLLQAAILLSAVALLLGIVNLLTVHVEKVRAASGNAFYSAILIVSFLAALLAWFDPSETIPGWLFQNIQIPVEASLMATLAVSLIYGSIRLLQRRPSLVSFVFISTAVLILLGSGPILGIELPGFGGIIKPWINQVLANAGARGILIGVALGAVATGLRILMGVDKPYGA
jgi:hypothetical protein